jgi:hypothetical protein
MGKTTEKHAGSARRTPSREAKKKAVERIQRDTREMNDGVFLTSLRRQGYDELPLEEIQDRLSKLRTAFAEFIVSRRG